MRRAIPLALFLAAGCSGGGSHSNETGRVTVKLLVSAAPAQDPFAGVTALHVEVREGVTVVFQDDFGAGVPISIGGLTAGTGRTVYLEGRDGGGAAISHGVTVPFDFTTGQNLQVPLYFGKIGSLNLSHGTQTPRVGAVSAQVSDGKVLIAGGIGLASADLYDPQTDTVTSAGTMPGGAHAFTQAAMLSADEVLVAGGSTQIATASAKADVFVYATGSGTGNWAASVPDMSVARRDCAVASFTGGYAIAAGGDAGSGIAVASTEVFHWTGTTGSWAAGDPMASARRGAVALPVEAGSVLIAGGTTGAGAYSKSSDIYRLQAPGATGNPGNDLRFNSAYMGIVPIDSATWLLAGGETAFTVLTAKTETVRWTGTDITSTNRDDLPGGAQARGGGGTSGTATVVAGGDTGLWPAHTAQDVALSFDGQSYAAIASSVGASTVTAAYPLPDGTAVVVADSGVYRYVP